MGHHPPTYNLSMKETSNMKTQRVRLTDNDPHYLLITKKIQVDSKRENMGQSTMFKENIIKERFVRHECCHDYCHNTVMSTVMNTGWDVSLWHKTNDWRLFDCRCLLLTCFHPSKVIFKAGSNDWQNLQTNIQRRIPKTKIASGRLFLTPFFYEYCHEYCHEYCLLITSGLFKILSGSDLSS